MTIPTLTPAERLAALDRQERAWRDILADAAEALSLHRDVLQSPAETLRELEARAATAHKALAGIAARRAALDGAAAP